MISAFKQSPLHLIHGIKCFTFWRHVHQVGTWIHFVQMHLWKVPRCLYKATLKTYHLPRTRPLLPWLVPRLFFMPSLFLEVFFLSPCLLGFPRVFFAGRLFFVPPLLPEAIFLFRCFLDFPRVLFADCQKREIRDMGEKPPEKSDSLHHSILEPTSDWDQCSQQNFRSRPNKKSKKDATTRGESVIGGENLPGVSFVCA